MWVRSRSLIKDTKYLAFVQLYVCDVVRFWVLKENHNIITFLHRVVSACMAFVFQLRKKNIRETQY